MKTTWRRISDSYYPRPTGSDVNTLPAGVYHLSIDGEGNQKLDYITDKLELPSRMYNVNEEFVNRVITAWLSTNTNLGILLSGLKGTGKSVIARQLANACGVPVIILDRNSGGPAQFISTYIHQDVCLFFDEFEKNFSQEKEDNEGNMAPLLSLLDGAGAGDKKLFSILTVNNQYGMEFLLNRPGRIRYHHTFKSLPASIYTVIIDDKLEYPEFREDLLSTCRDIHNLSIDTVTKLVQEVNLFQQPASKLAEDMNIEFQEFGYDVTFIQLDADNNLTKCITTLHNRKFSQKKENLKFGNCVYIDGAYIGDFVDCIDDDNSYIIDIGGDQIKLFNLKSTFSKKELSEDYVTGRYVATFAESTEASFPMIRQNLHLLV